jgi:hypothetical protein
VIRVGFRLIGGAAWQGGRNYLWNLLHAITALPERKVQPVLLLGPGEQADDLAIDGVERELVDDRLAGPRMRRASRIVKLATGYDPVELRSLRRARIDVVSHGTPVGRSLPAIGWVPDVQHRQLPELTSRRDRLIRDVLFRELLRDANIVLTSSEAARVDLCRFYAANPAKLRVLRFVSQPRLPRDGMLALDELRGRYGIPPRFVHLPNQLWKHKNHALVVEALRLVPNAVVVATGPREDFRHAGVYEELMALVSAYGLSDRFVHLGLVSFPELISLMHHAVAVINPSRFEGWSTTVEEAKSLGKQVLVSDIAVHREQDPARARFFPVDDARACADALGAAWDTYDQVEDARAAAAAAAALPARTRAFAETYQSIVLECVR